MAILPKKDRLARTGSNLRGKVSIRPDFPVNRSLQKLERQFRRERAQFIKPTDRRAAATLVREAEAAWQQAALAVGGHADRREALRLDTKARLQRSLRRTIKGYSAYLALKRRYLKQRRKLAGTDAKVRHPHVTLALGALATPLTIDVQEFVAPFPRYAILAGDIHGLLTQEDSFISPDVGHLIQNFTFEHDESAWGLSSQVNFVDHLASCGVDFTMPHDGNLQIAAEIENLANRLNCSITDYYGFSHSTLEMRTDLFVAIVRADTTVEYLPIRLLTSWLYSDGDDVARSFSDLATFEPYAMGGVSLRPIPAGETVTVLAGAWVRIDSDTDDMDAHVRATFWWRLNRIQIGVI